MSFNSFEFLAFLPITLILYFTANRFNKNTLAKVLLIVASLVFYAFAGLNNIWVIVLSILVNFGISKLLKNKGCNKKVALIFGLIFNIVLLFAFKYVGFTVDCINSMFKTDWVYNNVILPLGISFFTFQQIAYLVDSYRNETENYSFIDYSLFVMFFPKIVQGPIALHNELIFQFNEENRKHFNFENFAKGLYAFSWGLTKKVLVADQLGKIPNFTYTNISSLSSFEAIITIFAYTLQLYFDFSGYCDMANGIALMFNIELPINFNSPYRATNISDFWNRWHITLTKFLTKYIYFPLGGSRCSKLRTYLNILVVFIVSGLWHGAGFTFLFWGLMHAVAQIIYRIGKKSLDKLPKFIMWALNFAYVNIAWVFFRANTIQDGFAMLKSVLNGGFNVGWELTEILLNIVPISVVTNFVPINNIFQITIIAFICGLVVLSTMKTNILKRLENFKPNFINFVTTFVALVFSVLSLSGVSTFLYANF